MAIRNPFTRMPTTLAPVKPVGQAAPENAEVNAMRTPAVPVPAPVAIPPGIDKNIDPAALEPPKLGLVQPIAPVAQPAISPFAPAQVAADTMNQLIDPNSQYIQNARRRGIEHAAARGLGNSSIAAGASQRAAIEAAQPLVNNAMGLLADREGRAFTGEQAQFDRDFRRTLQNDSIAQQDWINSQSFNREFYGALSMMPINSAFQLNTMIQQYALENPDVYTQNVISGMSNFFNQNMAQILRDYFPQNYAAPTGAP